MLAAGRHQACTKPGPGSDLEVQDNDKSTDDLNSYWLQLQTKLNLSESMNAVDLVYCPVLFDTSALLVRQARRCSGNKSSRRSSGRSSRMHTDVLAAARKRPAPVTFRGYSLPPPIKKVSH